ncbi:RagB/SusD family nutrient uptake outer membrane protein [Pedobacter boryungensis]|uniref:RagB/SusD family nutrient uptake outer membrane protein n=1 Tax=Pedobacter boryungensis TaxID=869962 RepID=A0ABX2DHP2_9SPHI|nr:RagB/SusD family nutrient uptake outer membrane protein [Pedobacter boryungensis]NQX32644.1 RagB/SusD family nutrient uptake outer membrane protein [Pedobacter boryungensis]
MKIKSLKYKILGVILVFTLSSSIVGCKKELDNELKNKTYADTFWESENDVDGALSGAYGLLRKSLNNQNNFFIWGDLATGVFATDDTNIQGAYGSGAFGVPYREDGAHNWTNWYRVVDLSNLVIENVTKMSDSKFAPGRKNYFLGEAYFLRGLAYFYMTRAWGDVPLQLEATTTAQQAQYKPATAASSILKQVIADGQKASALLTWDGGQERVRASKGAALSLLTHATAWDNDYSKTLLYADSIIASGKFQLQDIDDIKLVFKNSNEPENIFVITQKQSDNESTNTGIAFSTVSNDIINGLPRSTPEYYVPTTKLSVLYNDPNDKRLAQFYLPRPNVTLNRALGKYAVFQNVGTSNSIAWRSENNIVIYRLADIILLKSEALNALNRDPEAQTALNLIRTRAGAGAINTTGVDLKKDILLERQRELAGEGQNYFDVVRNSYKSPTGYLLFGQVLSWTMDPGRFAAKGYYWPISNTILNANKLLSQIPWWRGKI